MFSSVPSVMSRFIKIPKYTKPLFNYYLYAKLSFIDDFFFLSCAHFVTKLWCVCDGCLGSIALIARSREFSIVKHSINFFLFGRSFVFSFKSTQNCITFACSLWLWTLIKSYTFVETITKRDYCPSRWISIW